MKRTILKKGIAILLLLLIVAIPSIFAGGTKEESKGEEVVTITMGSWRTDDVSQMNAVFDAFSRKYPNIKVKFDPTNPPDYNATLRLQLEGGIGPDVMYARSYATGAQLYKDGFFAELSGLSGINDNYTVGAKSPWTTADGNAFAIPFVAVSHGIYYNMDMFNDNGWKIPETWEDFISLCDTVKAAGITPLANSLGDEWDIAEVVFMNIAPSFIGGYEGRLEYDNGERKYNDEQVVALFQAMADLESYLPEGYAALSYNDNQAIFMMGNAAMYFDGSWTAAAFEAADPSFDWSVFAVPAPKGKDAHVTFHADAGIAINAATEHREEAEILLAWLGSAEGASVLANSLPTGFFPMSNNAVTIENKYADAFIKLNEGRGLDVRWPWPNLLGGEPSGYELIMNGSIAVIKGTMTAQEAADAFQNGLAEWYPPAQK